MKIDGFRFNDNIAHDLGHSCRKTNEICNFVFEKRIAI